MKRFFLFALFPVLLVFAGCVDLAVQNQTVMVPVDPAYSMSLDLLFNPEVSNPIFNDLAIPQVAENVLLPEAPRVENPEPGRLLDVLMNPAVKDPLAAMQRVSVPMVLPVEISRVDQWKGSQCGMIKPVHVVFSQAGSWKIFWERVMTPYSMRFRRIPAVDFNRYYVVGVFMGTKLTPGYEIEILSTEIKKSPGLRPVMTVLYRDIRHPQAIFQPGFVVHPFHLMRVPAFKGKITFVESRK